MTTTYSYGNRTLRAVTLEGRIWFLLEDVSAMTGVEHRSSDLRSAGLRPDIDFALVNVSELPDDTPKGGVMRGRRILVSDSGFFELAFRGRSEFSIVFRNWIKDEVWPALLHDGFYVSPEGSVVKELMDQVVLLRAEVTVLRAERALGMDATLRDLVGTDLHEEG